MCALNSSYINCSIKSSILMNQHSFPGSWRPIGHMRPSSPLLDSVRDQFEDHDQIAKDFTRMFLNTDENIQQNGQLFDVIFMVGQSKQKTRLIGVRAILGVRSRVFQEMLYGIQTGFGSPQVAVAELLARPVPTLISPQQNRPKSSNFLQVRDSTIDKSLHQEHKQFQFTSLLVFNKCLGLFQTRFYRLKI